MNSPRSSTVNVISTSLTHEDTGTKSLAVGSVVESYPTNWIGTSPAGGTIDTSIFHYAARHAHSGSTVALIRSPIGADALAGTLALADPLKTVAARKFTIIFFCASVFSGPA